MSGARALVGMAIAAAATLAACDARDAEPPRPTDPRLAAAERLIDDFYSFEPQRLRAALANAPESAPEILYYQGWAEGGNYVVLKRQPCRLTGPGKVDCAITVRDDLIAALGTGYDVTDTFHLSFKDSWIVAVETSSNDPPEFERAFEWLQKERPELFEGPCKNLFAGGPTPQDCVRAVVAGFADYTKRKPR